MLTFTNLFNTMFTWRLVGRLIKKKILNISNILVAIVTLTKIQIRSERKGISTLMSLKARTLFSFLEILHST